MRTTSSITFDYKPGTRPINRGCWPKRSGWRSRPRKRREAARAIAENDGIRSLAVNAACRMRRRTSQCRGAELRCLERTLIDLATLAPTSLGRLQAAKAGSRSLRSQRCSLMIDQSQSMRSAQPAVPAARVRRADPRRRRMAPCSVADRLDPAMATVRRRSCRRAVRSQHELATSLCGDDASRIHRAQRGELGKAAGCESHARRLSCSATARSST